MIPFEKKQLGKTGLMIPNLGLGTATLSGDSLAEGLYGGSAEKEAISILNESYKKGFRYIDTAPLYGTGKAEERIGKSIFSKIDKSKFIISSKDLIFSSNETDSKSFCFSSLVIGAIIAKVSTF